MSDVIGKTSNAVQSQALLHGKFQDLLTHFSAFLSSVVAQVTEKTNMVFIQFFLKSTLHTILDVILKDWNLIGMNLKMS